MTERVRTSDAANDDAIVAAVAHAFAEAEFRPDLSAGTVTPLRQLIAAYPLTVDELQGLTRGSAAAYLTAERGRQVMLAGEQEEKLSGFAYGNTAGCWILVNRDSQNPLVRRRFTIAHEFGHYLLHFRPRLAAERDVQFQEALGSTDNLEGEGPDTGTVSILAGDAECVIGADVAAMEDEANQFAADVLMPEVVCRRRVETLTARYGDHLEPLARRLSADFLVSLTAMQRRLRDLGLL